MPYKDKEKRAERSRIYYEANREKVKEQHRLYRATNLEKVKEQQRLHRATNTEQRLERLRNYYRRERSSTIIMQTIAIVNGITHGAAQSIINPQHES